MIPHRAKKYIIALSAAALLYPTAEFSRHLVFSSRGLDLYNVVKEKDGRGREIFSLRDQSYDGQSIPFITDLLLSFNGPSSALVKDDSRNYSVRYASYNLEKNKGSLGGGAGHFFKRDHRVEIETDRNLWLANCSDLGSFTIEMRFLPYGLSDGSVLFSSTGFNDGKKSGIEITTRGRRVTVRLFRVFKDENGRRIDVFLNRGAPLREGRWHHFALSFDRLSGKLAVLLNGEESEVVYMTKEGEPFFGVYEPSFSCADTPVAVAGKNFVGLLDELRISHRHIDDLKKETELALRNYRKTGAIGRMPVNAEGIITSGVHRFDHTGTKVVLFQWEELERSRTHVWMEFRISDDLFDRNDLSLKWHRIENRQRNIYLKKSGDLFLRGKYCQWRAHLIASPDGESSPGVYDISLHYDLDLPPRPPLMFETAAVGDGSATLRWKKNVEPDIAGYKIYYGIRPGRYDGVIKTVDGARISNDFNPGRNYIEVTLNSAVVEENRAKDRSGMLDYPIIRNDVLYYFAVSAYDSYRVDTSYNHESGYSTEITARPTPGSEITR